MVTGDGGGRGATTCPVACSWPQRYGVVTAGIVCWLEHAGWVVFEDLFLIYSCVRSIRRRRCGSWPSTGIRLEGHQRGPAREEADVRRETAEHNVRLREEQLQIVARPRHEMALGPRWRRRRPARPRVSSWPTWSHEILHFAHERHHRHDRAWPSTRSSNAEQVPPLPSRTVKTSAQSPFGRSSTTSSIFSKIEVRRQAWTWTNSPTSTWRETAWATTSP